MNRSKIIAFLFLLVLLQSVQAQVGIKAGGNIATMTSDADVNSKSGAILRFHMGVIGKPVRLSDSWYFEPEFLLSWKGQRYKYDITIVNGNGTKYQRATSYKNKFTYFEIPLMFEKGLYEKVSLEFGPYLSLRIAGKRSGETTVTTTTSGGSSSVQDFPEDGTYFSYPDGTDAKRPLESFDVGFNIGAQYHWKEGINFGIRYNFGLIDITKDSYPVKNASNNHEATQTVQLYASYYLGD